MIENEEERKSLFLPVFLTLCIAVVGFMIWAFTSESNTIDRNEAKCNDVGGVYVELYMGDDVCLKKDSVISIE